MNKFLIAVTQIALFAAASSGASASAEECRETSMETANHMCVIIDDKLVCAPMADAMIRPVSSEQS